MLHVMSKHNVNPNHYKVAGRERQGEDILQARHRMKLTQVRAQERFEARQSDVSSVPMPAGEPPPPEEAVAGDVTERRADASPRGRAKQARKTSGARVKKAGASGAKTSRTKTSRVKSPSASTGRNAGPKKSGSRAKTGGTRSRQASARGKRPAGAASRKPAARKQASRKR